MPGCYIYVWLFLFVAFARDALGVTVQMGLYNRVELKGENLDQQTIDSLKEVEWTRQFNLNKSCLCLKFLKQNGSEKAYSKCCGNAHFYLNSNSLVLENVTAQDEVVFKETIITKNGTTKILNFTLNIICPPEAIGIVVSWRCNNTSVSFTCEVNGTFTDIMWKREDSPILKDNRHSFSETNQTLHISNITSSDYGTYSCVATNSYRKSETQTYITNEEYSTHCENSTPDNSKHEIMQIALSSGLTIGISGLCIILFYGIKTCSHSHRGEDGRTTEEGDVDTDLAIYQEVPDTAVVSLPYVYTDFIKPREVNENSASATENTEDFGYSEIGPAVREDFILDHSSSDEQSTPCPNAEDRRNDSEKKNIHVSNASKNSNNSFKPKQNKM